MTCAVSRGNKTTTRDRIMVILMIFDSDVYDVTFEKKQIR